MIRTILKFVLIGMVVLLVALWLWAGGFTQIVRFVKTIPNPIDILWGTSTSTYKVELPWQLPIPQGADIELLANEADYYAYSDEEAQLEELERQYENLKTQAQNIGRSPHYGKVSLSRASATDGYASEFLILDARMQTVSLSGWSLQSQLSGNRVAIPLAAPVYDHGYLNNVQPVVLEPGMSAILSTGFSPTGVSFRENRCTGYLAQLVNIEPHLANACPSPAESLSLTDQNLMRYGGECIDYVRALPQCTFPTTIPLSLPAACRLYIANTFSYNGCVQTYQSDPSFGLETWRLYLGSSQELWGNTHDIIRLIDDRGLLVDSVTY